MIDSENPLKVTQENYLCQYINADFFKVNNYQIF